jgi:hypothetical protein
MPTTRVGIAVEGIPSIRKALTAVGDGDWLTKSMDEIGRDGRVDIQMDAPRHLINNVGFIGVRGEGTATRAMFKVSINRHEIEDAIIRERDRSGGK